MLSGICLEKMEEIEMSSVNRYMKGDKIMRKINIKVEDLRECFVALGKDYLDYSIYGDGSWLDKYDKSSLIEEMSGKSFDEETEWCDVNLNCLGIPDDKYIELGMECFRNGILFTEDEYDSIAGQIVSALYGLKNIDLSGRKTRVFISLKVDDSKDFLPSYYNGYDESLLSIFASPLEYLF